MARLHILAGNGDNTYRCVLHETVSLGNNVAGVPWRTALVNSGLGGTTSMATGTGAGQITAAELAQVQSGEILEVAFQFQNDPAWNATQRNAAMDAQIAIIAGETQTRIAAALRVFGLTR